MNDAGFCERIVFRHARTFALASRLLPPEKRRGAFAIYAFCRTADDVVDLAMPGESADRVAQRLGELRDALDSREALAHPIMRELRWAIARFNIEPSLLRSLLAGVERDLMGSEYDTWSELQNYCQQVASSVGEMCTAVFGVAVPGGLPTALEHARLLGIAMQLTNILRDVGEDRSRGRCYLPEEDLQRFGLTRSLVLTEQQMERRPEWRELMAFEIARARATFDAALPGVRLLAADAQRCAWACAAGYAAILDAIEANGFDTLTRRAVVGASVRARVLWRAWLRRTPELALHGRSGADDSSHAAA